MDRVISFGIAICLAGLFADASVLSRLEKPHIVNEAPRDERAFYTEFVLRTIDNRKEPERGAFVSGVPPTFNNFNAERETIVLLPGATVYGQGYSLYYTSFLSYAFLKNGNYNVISVEWNHLVDLNLLRYTLNNAVFVGELTAALINSLRNKYENINKFNVVGHQYGTISAAVAGSLLEKKLERLTALDPQKIPLYVKLPHWARLERACANIVEVIHTSGFTTAMGHRDFYPNGGTQPQPGCSFDFFDYCSSEKSFIVYGADIISGGNHYTATNCETYENFLGDKCNNRETVSLWNTEGSHSVPTGSYFFNTEPQTKQLQLERRNLDVFPQRLEKFVFSRQ